MADVTDVGHVGDAAARNWKGRLVYPMLKEYER